MFLAAPSLGKRSSPDVVLLKHADHASYSGEANSWLSTQVLVPRTYGSPHQTQTPPASSRGMRSKPDASEGSRVSWIGVRWSNNALFQPHRCCLSKAIVCRGSSRKNATFGIFFSKMTNMWNLMNVKVLKQTSCANVLEGILYYVSGVRGSIGT